jgi:hypothetical protein
MMRTKGGVIMLYPEAPRHEPGSALGGLLLAAIVVALRAVAAYFLLHS